VPSTPADSGVRRPPRNLANTVVEALTHRVREGQVKVGDRLPTEASVMGEFGVSRTVVREALSKLQAAGIVETKHGIGTFVIGTGEAKGLKLAPEQLATVRDVIAVLELRIGLESEAAGLAAIRRTDEQLRRMHELLNQFATAVAGDTDALSADFDLHMEIARASQNPHFAALMNELGTLLIPRSRLNTAHVAGEARREYLQRVHTEHEAIVRAIAAQEPEAARAAMRTHLANSRERLRRAQEGVGA
jgi:DNA-binding FadR family transcriptional regulator